MENKESAINELITVVDIARKIRRELKHNYNANVGMLEIEKRIYNFAAYMNEEMKRKVI